MPHTNCHDSRTRRSNWNRGCVAVLIAVLAQSAQAATVNSNNNVFHGSFWDPNNWFLAQPPAAGDIVQIVNGVGTFYLGDAPPFAAQSLLLTRMHFTGTSSSWTIDWGGLPTGSGLNGGLTFSQDDPADFFVGIRIGSNMHPSTVNSITFIDAENTAAQKVNVRLGSRDPRAFGSQGNALELRASSILSATTFHTGFISMDSDRSLLRIYRGMNLVTDLLGASPETTGSQVDVSGGRLLAERASFDQSLSLLVHEGGRADIAFGALINGTIQIGSSSGPAPPTGGLASIGRLDAIANGGKATVGVDGLASGGSLLGINYLDGFARTGGTLDLIAKNGGSLAIADGAFWITSGGKVTVQDTAAARLSYIHLDASGGVAQALLTIKAVSRPLHTVVTGSVNIGSDFYRYAGSQTGGDLPIGGGSRVELLNGSRLRIGDTLSRPELPLLAIGTDGSFMLDSTSAVFIGRADATARYDAGMIVLDTGGYIHGNGVINGVGFPAGMHLKVLNTGGEMHSGFSPGKLTIDGEYIQEAGALVFEISGLNPSEYDVLDATMGASFLGGTLRFQNLGGITGVIGLQFDFFAGRSVFFGPGVVFEDNTGFGLAFDLTTGIGTITIGSAVPEPSIAPLMLAGLAVLGWLARRRQPVIATAGALALPIPVC